MVWNVAQSNRRVHFIKKNASVNIVYPWIVGLWCIKECLLKLSLNNLSNTIFNRAIKK